MNQCQILIRIIYICFAGYQSLKQSNLRYFLGLDDFLLAIKDYERVTLLTATKSMEQNHAGILKEYVEGLLR